jgi:hypothetical protein
MVARFGASGFLLPLALAEDRKNGMELSRYHRHHQTATTTTTTTGVYL